MLLTDDFKSCLRLKPTLNPPVIPAIKYSLKAVSGWFCSALSHAMALSGVLISMMCLGRGM